MAAGARGLDKIPVADLVSREPVTTSARATVAEAAARMREADVGGLIVVSGDEPVGIVTERDIVRKVVAAGRSSETTHVHDVMSRELVCIDATADVSDAARTMAQFRVRRLPVVGPDGLVGVLTDRDLLAVSPALFDLAREGAARVREARAAGLAAEGRCEGCGDMTDSLAELEGSVLCDDCVDDRR